jgi:hypothetical protein
MDTIHYDLGDCFDGENQCLYPGIYDDQYDDHDDFNEIPVNMQEELREYILKTLFPDVLKHMDKCGYKTISGVEINHVSIHLLGEFIGPIERAFNPKQHYDLYAMHRTFVLRKRFYKKDGKELVGAAIRISEAIGKKEHVDKLKQIVKDCFIPNVVPDPDHLIPFHIDLDDF